MLFAFSKHIEDEKFIDRREVKASDSFVAHQIPKLGWSWGHSILVFRFLGKQFLLKSP